MWLHGCFEGCCVDFGVAGRCKIIENIARNTKFAVDEIRCIVKKSGDATTFGFVVGVAKIGVVGVSGLEVGSGDVIFFAVKT